MKANLLLNCSGLNPELISKRPRPDSVSSSCRCRVLTTLLLCLTLGVGDVWGETIYNEDFGSNTTSKTKAFSSSTDFSEETTWSIMTDGGWNQGRDASSPSDYSGASGNAYAQKSSSAGDLILVFGDLTDYTDVVLSFGYRNGAGGKVARTFAAYVSGDGGDTWTEIECNKSRKTQTWEKITYEVPAAKLTDFAVKFSNTSNNQSAVDDVILTGTAAASCSVNPTIGDASLNGSISLSSFPVQTTGWTVGANCAWSDFGFVWSSTVSTPTLAANGTASSGCTKIQKATSGTSTSTTHSITGSFFAGTTYYVRGYGKNGYASGSYQYTDVLTITPRSVEFNSNGGSAVDTKYVNSGTKVTAPSDPTKTGYNFGEWQLNSSEFDFANTNVTSNITLVATWTAKTTTISFNQNSGTGGQTGTLTATYDAAMPSAPVTCPTRTGYDFGGYYDGSGGTGTQYYTNTGASARNWDKENSTWTLYAKWTIKNYTVTWKVNNTNYTTGTPTSSVNHGSHVTTLPTAPDPGSYCGDKFMGWTDATDGAYVHGTSNLYTKASDFPNATGNQVFYAVFADYTTD